MPPSKSGIADYSAALAGELSKHMDLTVFDSAPKVDLARFDIAVYQLGNNPYHSFVYEAALKTPGVAVMHESNLHHLMTDLTIRRGDWDSYVAECEYLLRHSTPQAKHAVAVPTGRKYLRNAKGQNCHDVG